MVWSARAISLHTEIAHHLQLAVLVLIGRLQELFPWSGGVKITPVSFCAAVQKQAA